MSIVWLINFSRSLLQDGRFNGVVILSVAPAYLSQVLAGLELAPQDSISLFDSQGTFLARNRGLDQVMGKTLAPARPFMLPGAAASGNYHGPAFDDSADRSFSWARLPSAPLVAVVGLDTRTALAPQEALFRQEQIRFNILSAIMIALGIAILLLLARLARQQQNIAIGAARFRGLADLSADWYWEQDQNFRFIHFSDPTKKLGSSVAWYYGKTRWEMPTVGVPPQQWAAHRAQLEAQQPFRDLDYLGVTESSEVIWMSTSGEPLFDHEGAFCGYHGFGRNITAQKQAAEALRANEERLRAIIDTEPEGVKVASPDGLLLEMNRAGLTMLEAESFEQLRGRPMLDLVAQEYHGAYAQFHQCVMQGENARLEFEVVGLRGGRRWVDVYATPLRGPDGQISGNLGIMRDITEHKSTEAQRQTLEAQLRQAQKMEAMGTLAGASRTTSTTSWPPSWATPRWPARTWSPRTRPRKA